MGEHRHAATPARFSFHPHASRSSQGRVSLRSYRRGLSDAQVRGSLGALLIFVRERVQ